MFTLRCMSYCLGSLCKNNRSQYEHVNVRERGFDIGAGAFADKPFWS